MQAGLFEQTYTLILTEEELEGVGLHFRRPIDNGSGGFQVFLSDLQAREHDGHLVVTGSELQRAYRYAYDYQGGGWQGSFKAIVRAGFRSGWK